MQAKIVPTFFHNRKTSEDVPIWEVTLDNGKKYNCQRTSVRGYYPLTVYGLSDYSSKDKAIHVAGATIPVGIRFPQVITVKDGFRLPRSWYAKDGENYTYVDFTPEPPAPPKDPKEFTEENFPTLEQSQSNNRR